MNKQSKIYLFLKKAENPGQSVFYNVMNRLMNAGLSAAGSVLYTELRKQYPGYVFLILPSCSAGDMTFLKPMLEYMMQDCEKYLLIVDNKGVLRFSEALGFQNLYPVSRFRLKALFGYHQLARASDLLDCYPWAMFDYQESALYKPDSEAPVYDAAKAKKIMKEKQLPPGKTVILSPYEQTISALHLPKLHRSFWEALAKELHQKGYTLCTNCAGTAEEPVICGTVQVFPELDITRELAEAAGNVVAVRSGFVDFIRDTSARKVILYPDNAFYHAWNLHRAGNIRRCCQIIYGDKKYSELIRNISEQFPEV